MTTTMTTTRYESFLGAARGYIYGNKYDWLTPEAVAALAVEQESCVWHAAHTLIMEHLDEAGYGTCRYCGGVTAPNQDNAHALCQARHDKGRETTTLDASPQCSCARCRPDVRRMI